MDKKDYICIHKRVVGSSVFQDPDVYRLFTWILVNCLDVDRPVLVSSNRQNIEVQGRVGECIFLKRQVVEETGMTRHVVSRCMDKLVSLDVIRCEREGSYTRATVINYKEYQTVRLENFCPDPDVHAWFRDDMPNASFDPRDASFPEKLANARFGSEWVRWCDAKESVCDPLSRADAEKQLAYILKHCSVSDAILRLKAAAEGLQSKKPAAKTRKEVSNEISKSPVYSDQFKDFWENYPNVRRGSKPDANRRFKENCQFLMDEEYIEVDGKKFAFESKERAAAFLITRAKVYSSSLTGQGKKFAKGAAAWLNGQNYLDSKESWESLSGAEEKKPDDQFNTWN